MRLSDLIQPFEQLIDERWEQSNYMELDEYCDYHSHDDVTIRYEKALKYLIKRMHRIQKSKQGGAE